MFAYRLGLKLGYANIDAMLDGMTSAQVTEWMAMYSIEPFGEWREDYRNGQICSLIFNSHIDPKKTQPATPQDFVLKMEKARKPRKLTQEQLNKKILEAFGVKK